VSTGLPETHGCKGGDVVKNVLNFYEERALMGFRETFVRLRKERGWTQQYVADQVGISVAQIKKYEKGDSAPTLPMLAKIATVFSVSADQLVFGEGKTAANNKLDAELLRRFEMIAELPPRERDAIILVLDSVIAKNRLREVIQG
jgi:transcriptional regulator with XRE-family HTH domain